MDLTCKQCAVGFEFSQEDVAFLERVSPVFNGEKQLLPAPQLCSECRHQRRFAWRNDMNLYRRNCDKTGKPMISMFAPDADVVVYDQKVWWGDDWDSMDYGCDFDFSRGFFEQFAELNREAPYPSLAVSQCENSDYTNYNMAMKNCYLCFAGNYVEDSIYCYNAQNSKGCRDCLFVWDCEDCYECVQCSNGYGLRFCRHSKNCSDSWFLEDCNGCRDCFMCFNLRNKQYCILNKQYSKEDYEKLLKEFDIAEMLERFEKERLKFPKRADHNLQVENCFGDYILQSKNCENCYIMAKGCEDCSDVLNGFPELKDGRSCSYSGDKADLMYETMASGGDCRHLLFTSIVFSGCDSVFYSSLLVGCKDCFGCVGLKKKQYCILNKQYTKEEYEELLPRIIENMRANGEWGEFFPVEISPFAYNETGAQIFFPMTKEEVLDAGWRWREEGESVASDDAVDVQHCEVSGRPFRMVKSELDFYEKNNLPLPKKCFQQRHKERFAAMNGRKLFDRKCGKCSELMRTAYSPESPEIVYCEQCYLAEVY